jgi:hypothetical protein
LKITWDSGTSRVSSSMAASIRSRGTVMPSSLRTVQDARTEAAVRFVHVHDRGKFKSS